MRLTKLQLSGFKSFARTTTFEFPGAISAVVGPNGSGKSNVAEAIRWVLGEQSMKTLRGKKGEDLIFSGSPQVARMGKAAVKLAFDNKDHSIPLDFPEVMLERKIFRDGTNEYYVNGSQVRLKDIVEMLARIGLGETKHNIIGQGEVDRILMVSPTERRELLEEAIGLRLYQLKKREAERKLEETEKNISQAAALIKEIGPHLKFLKSQADKAEKGETLRKELEDYYRALVQKETAAIAEEVHRLKMESSPAAEKLKKLGGEIAAIQSEIDAAESDPGSSDLATAKEQELKTLETKRRDLERELGRIEGRMESALPSSRTEAKSVHISRIENALRPRLQELREAATGDDITELKRRIEAVAANIGQWLEELKHSRGQAAGAAALPTDLENSKNRIHEERKNLDQEFERLRRELDRDIQNIRSRQARFREYFKRRHEREEEAGALRGSLQRFGFEKEKLDLREKELERLIQESGLERRELESGDSPFMALEAGELRKKIERLKARLEEIGGIDPAVLKEYRDTKSRHEFLEREHNDLAAAQKNLCQLTEDLEERIERDFKMGFEKIQKEFHHYFRIIFGGGRGALAYAALRRPLAEGEEETEAEKKEIEYGIDIDVDLPQKRIKGLAMLSGGERALVSAALLFAITAVNPPPFLVLDETDAALDEANSQKYAAILKELSQKTQLILITHNRETMQRAGVLYGVTMGDDGISKILSLKLEEAESYGNR